MIYTIDRFRYAMKSASLGKYPHYDANVELARETLQRSLKHLQTNGWNRHGKFILQYNGDSREHSAAHRLALTLLERTLYAKTKNLSHYPTSWLDSEYRTQEEVEQVLRSSIRKTYTHWFYCLRMRGMELLADTTNRIRNMWRSL